MSRDFLYSSSGSLLSAVGRNAEELDEDIGINHVTFRAWKSNYDETLNSIHDERDEDRNIVDVTSRATFLK